MQESSVTEKYSGIMVMWWHDLCCKSNTRIVYVVLTDFLSDLGQVI